MRFASQAAGKVLSNPTGTRFASQTPSKDSAAELDRFNDIHSNHDDQVRMSGFGNAKVDPYGYLFYKSAATFPSRRSVGQPSPG